MEPELQEALFALCKMWREQKDNCRADQQDAARAYEACAQDLEQMVWRKRTMLCMDGKP